MNSRSLLPIVLLALLPLPSVASPEALQQARVYLQAGKADEAFFALEESPPTTPEEAGTYAELLSAAARVSLGEADAIFALQLCRQALVHRPESEEARLVCLEAAMVAKSHDEAAVHLTALEAHRPKEPSIVLWRARLSDREAEWERARTAADLLPLLPGATEAQKTEAKGISSRAAAGLADRDAMRTQARVEQRTRSVRKYRARNRHRSKPTEPELPPKAKTGWEGLGPHVVLYCDTSRLCRWTRRRLDREKVRYEDRNLSLDRSARDDLEDLGKSKADVPIFDLHGEVTRSIATVLQSLKEHGELP